METAEPPSGDYPRLPLLTAAEARDAAGYIAGGSCPPLDELTVKVPHNHSWGRTTWGNEPCEVQLTRQRAQLPRRWALQARGSETLWSGRRLPGVVEEVRGGVDAVKTAVSAAVAAEVAEARCVVEGCTQSGHVVNLPVVLETVQDPVAQGVVTEKVCEFLVSGTEVGTVEA
ncbi:hypothetical protein ACWDX6_28700 [Streptomyces sp. NPDC003027]